MCTFVLQQNASLAASTSSACACKTARTEVDRRLCLLHLLASLHAGELRQFHLHRQRRHTRRLHRQPDHQVRAGHAAAPKHRPHHGKHAHMKLHSRCAVITSWLYTTCSRVSSIVGNLSCVRLRARSLVETMNKKNKGANVKPFMVKQYLSVFINCMIENPAFESQARTSDLTASRLLKTAHWMTEPACFASSCKVIMALHMSKPFPWLAHHCIPLVG